MKYGVSLRLLNWRKGNQSEDFGTVIIIIIFVLNFVYYLKKMYKWGSEVVVDAIVRARRSLVFQLLVF